jgi:DNA-directed RNA polymerase specialized sigma24 family protein
MKATERKRKPRNQLPARNDVRQERSVQLINILKWGRKSLRDKAFEELVELVGPTLNAVALKFTIPGTRQRDVWQEILYCLRFKAVPDYNGTSSFNRFAALCCRRWLLTLAHNAKRNPLNFAEPLAFSYDDGNGYSEAWQPESSALIDPLSDFTEEAAEREEVQDFFSLFSVELSPFEQTVISELRREHSVSAVARKLKAKPKAIENARARIKQKASAYIEREGLECPLSSSVEKG